MAKKKTETQEEIVETATTEEVVTVEDTAKAIEAQQKENDELREQLKAMQAQMALLMQGMTAQAQPVAKKRDKNVEFINMTNGTIVLRGSTVYTIEGQFSKRSFVEHEARMIVNNMPETIRSGMVYINDAEFIEENNLSDVYDGLLTDKQLKELLQQDYTLVVETYKSAGDKQKQIIVDMITDARLKGKRIDGNIIIELGELCGKNFLEIEKMDE